MNIFVLDMDPVKAAQYHVDAHCAKLILEAAQMMSTAIHLHPPKRMPKELYGLGKSHANHPCTKWVRESLSNYRWLASLARALNSENQFRGSHARDHRSWLLIEQLGEPRIPDEGLTDFAQAMPDHLRADDVVTAYRNYYVASKTEMWSWKRRGAPDWLLPHHRWLCHGRP